MGPTPTRSVRCCWLSRRAKDRLPPDTRSLVLIMSDIGQGGINAAAIQIEQAHTDLEEGRARPADPPTP